MAGPLILPIIPIDIADTQTLEYLRERFWPLLQQQMNMISHQAIGVQGKVADLLAIGKALKILLTVLVILEDDLAVNPSEHNMKDTAFTLFSGISWHKHTPSTIVVLGVCFVKTKEPSPCLLKMQQRVIRCEIEARQSAVEGVVIVEGRPQVERADMPLTISFDSIEELERFCETAKSKYQDQR